MDRTDENLMTAVQQGDMSAFDELYRRYEGPLFGFIHRYLASREESEEVFHETFMKALKYEGFDFSKGSFKGWIYQVARNLSLDRLKRASRREMATEDVGQVQDLRSLETVQAGSSPEELYESQDEGSRLRRASRKLPQTLRQLFDLRLRGRTHREISQELGLPVGTVKSRIHTMVGLLREEISP